LTSTHSALGLKGSHRSVPAGWRTWARDIDRARDIDGVRDIDVSMGQGIYIDGARDIDRARDIDGAKNTESYRIHNRG
jgi:hypothetical protein